MIVEEKVSSLFEGGKGGGGTEGRLRNGKK